MKNLMPMTDFVLNGQQTADYIKLYDGCFKYANFLKQPLELWMFVPCKLVDGVWVVVSDMSEFPCIDVEYQQAKQRCLFEVLSFENNIGNYWYFGKDEFVLIGVEKSENVESLCAYNLQLTPTAIKQLGL